MIRFGLIRQHYPAGADQRALEAALEALLERSVAVTLFTRRNPESRLKLMDVTVCNPFHIGRWWRDRSFARSVGRAVAAVESDLVESHERVACCDVYFAREGVHAVALEQYLRGASWWRRQRIASGLYHRSVLASERRVYASPWLRAVICRSELVRSQVSERFGVSPEHLHVVRDAVDTDAWHPGLRSLRGWLRSRYHISDSATVFLLAGVGYHRNGLPAVLAALAELSGNVHLLVVGPERNPGRFRRLARQYGVDDRVTFAGPQVEAKPFFGAADVFVLPTVYDPLPASALEALACGLPVITSTMSGAAEIVTAADAGLVCDAFDVGTLAGHMRLLQHASAREPLSARARAAALELTPAAVTLKRVMLYRDLLAASLKARGDASQGPWHSASSAQPVTTTALRGFDSLRMLRAHREPGPPEGIPESARSLLESERLDEDFAVPELAVPEFAGAAATEPPQLR